jgi:hypothetical protein
VWTIISCSRALFLQEPIARLTMAALTNWGLAPMTVSIFIFALTNLQHNYIVVLSPEAVLLPDFDANGNLPSGIHRAAWKEFSKRFGHCLIGS